MNSLLSVATLAALTSARALPGGPSTATPAPSQPPDDLVETVQDDPAKPAVQGSPQAAPIEAPPPPPTTPSSDDSYTVSGWALEELHLTLGRSPTDPPYLAVPLDRAISRTRAFVGARYARARWFEADVSGVISYSYFVRGLGGDLSDDFHEYATRGSFEPAVRELYIAFFTPNLDIRIGQQRVAWGRADAQSPNDVLNARDLRDPLQPEPALSQIPTPLARVDWSLGPATLQGIWAPIFVPDQLDLYGTNWAIVQPDAPAGTRGFFRLMSSMVDPSMVDPFNRLIQQTQIPGPRPSNMSYGAKLSASAGDVDFDAYYHYGFDRTPLLRADPAFQDALNRTDFSQAKAADFGAAFSAIQAGRPPQTVEYIRRHHVGLDASTVLGSVGVRVDVAYDTERVFFRRDFTGASSPALQGVLSLEYQTGDTRQVFLLEGSVLRLLDDAGALLFTDRTSFTATGLVRYPLGRAFDAELRAVVSALPESVLLRPQLGWRAADHWTVDVGGLWLEGQPWSFGHYFRRNSEVYMNIKYSL